MTIKELESAINEALRRVNPKYGISKLVETSKGDYWFDFSVRFAGKDMPAVNKILSRYLGKKRRREDEEIIQAKFYLPASLCQALRELSAKTGKPQSKIVEERLTHLLR